jgi:hypothetical protein
MPARERRLPLLLAALALMVRSRTASPAAAPTR